jgi:hypothetical protein
MEKKTEDTPAPTFPTEVRVHKVHVSTIAIVAGTVFVTAVTTTAACEGIKIWMGR